MTASLPDRRSFAIDIPNGIKVSRYYHMPISILEAVRIYPSVSCVPISAPTMHVSVFPLEKKDAQN
jgi:hypothetical protein